MPPRATRSRAPLAKDKSTWYRITNLASGTAEVAIYDEVGYFGVSASSFVEELKELDVDDIALRINSPGGEIFDGIAIMNALRSHRAYITTHVDGIAASIASVIAMAGDRIIMQPHSQMMIHDGSGMCVGNAQDMRDMADLLDRQSDNIADIYTARAGGRKDRWRARMRAETWYSAEEAVKAGLADAVAKPERRVREPMDNRADTGAWDLSTFRYAGRDEAPEPDTDPVPEMADTAVGPHEADTVETPWDEGENIRRLPSPMSVETARKVYAWYDEAQVEDGMIVKAACKLPHHVVDADGTPGAASLPGVRNALARLPQTEGLSDEERDTIQRHLRAHLDDAEGEEEEEAQLDNHARAELADWSPDLFAGAIAHAAASMPGWDPAMFRDAVRAHSDEAPATTHHRDTTPPPDPGWCDPAPPPDHQPVTHGELFHAAVMLESANAPAPTQRVQEPEPDHDYYDPTVFTRALREAMR